MREKVYPVSLSRKDRDSTAFLYERLSRDVDRSYGQPFFIKKLTALNLLQFRAV